MGEPEGTRPAEEWAEEYLRLREEGTAPDLEGFLSGVPEAERDACRSEIRAALRLHGVLEEIGGTAGPPRGDPPRVPGFRIEHRIGEGALGTVYAAWDESLERRVALKVLRRGTAAHLRTRVLEEARKSASLGHPNVVTVHSVVDSGDTPAIVMELVEGFPIDRASEPLTQRQRARLLLRLVVTAGERRLVVVRMRPREAA